VKEKQTAELIAALAELDRQFKLRLEQLEREHTMRLMALFQEFKARAFATKNKRPMASLDDGNGNTIAIQVMKRTQ
jgi:hypothetical protein